MKQGQTETVMIRLISCTFVVVALAVFKPFGLDTWQWQNYIHLLAIGVIGFIICMLTDVILKHIIKMPRSYEKGVSYIIRRNLWFQLINTPLVSLGICLYRHFALNNIVEGNQLSFINYLETLAIIAFCSFAIGLYWRFKFRSRYLAAELEEMRLLNDQLKRLQEETEQQTKDADVNKPTPVSKTPSDNVQSPSVLTLTGTTNESVTLQISDLLYVEAVGNYVKVCRLHDGKVHTDMLRATSKQIEDELRPYPMIIRCHRAFLVNLGQVEKIISNSSAMQLIIRHSHDALPVSRSNVAGVKAAIKGVASL